MYSNFDGVTGSPLKREGSGRPRKTTPAEDANILECFRSNRAAKPLQPAKEFHAKDMTPKLSRCTSTQQIQVCKGQECQNCHWWTDRQAQRGADSVVFGSEVHIKVDVCEYVLFSVEVEVYLNEGGPHMWIFPVEERYDANLPVNNVANKSSESWYLGQSVQWGEDFWLPWKEIWSLDSMGYRDLLADHLVPFLENIRHEFNSCGTTQLFTVHIWWRTGLSRNV